MLETTKRGYRLKPLSEMTLKDDFMFCRVMEKEEMIRPLLEKLIHKRIGKIHYVNPHHELQASVDSKRVVLDIFLEEEKRIINVEMQKVNQGDLLRRARLYHNEIDLFQSTHGLPYKDFKDNIVIFVCDFDLFKENQPIYYCRSCYNCNISFEKMDKSQIVDDGIVTIYLNLKSTAEILDPELKAFYTYMKSGLVSTEYTNQLDHMVSTLKINKEVSSLYMFFYSKWDDYKIMIEEACREEWEEKAKKEGLEKGMKEGMEQGIKEGMEQGIEKGAAQSKAEIAKQMLLYGDSVEKVSICTGLSLTEVQALV